MENLKSNVKQHGGFVTAEREKDKGSAFTVYLGCLINTLASLKIYDWSSEQENTFFDFI